LWINSLKAATTIRENIVGAFFKRKGITVYANDPHYVAKVVLA
jgi:hypothetical protein